MRIRFGEGKMVCRKCPVHGDQWVAQNQTTCSIGIHKTDTDGTPAKEICGRVLKSKEVGFEDGVPVTA